MLKKLNFYLYEPISIAPLVVFRFLFGAMMLWSIIRFWSKGWIETLYIKPGFHFSYYGFEWVKPIGNLTYLLFIICGLSAFMISIGYKYRIAIITFFLSFTYIELMDKTTYLNHYYFISLMSFVMIFLPANSYFSVDAKLKPFRTFVKTPRWTILIVQILLGIVYFYAGLAKLNSDWLFRAMPLKIWLPGNENIPLIGIYLKQEWFIFAMAWAGAIYDLCIPFLLFNKKTRIFAFLLVVIFHVLTRILFPIGMFPFIMICSTLVFFSASFHQKIIDRISGFLGKVFKWNSNSKTSSEYVFKYKPISGKIIKSFLAFFIVMQLLLPFRYLTYPGELFWNEQGFRFSWRVMLMDKVGYTAFWITDDTGKKTRVEASSYLTTFQEKQMSFQPDFIIEFAHFLAKEYHKKGYKNPKVYADSFVALNGRESKRFIDPKVDLAQEKIGFKNKTWILPMNEKIKGINNLIP